MLFVVQFTLFPCLVVSHSFFVPIHLLPLRRVVLNMFSITILLDIERTWKLTLWFSKKNNWLLIPQVWFLWSSWYFSTFEFFRGKIHIKWIFHCTLCYLSKIQRRVCWKFKVINYFGLYLVFVLGRVGNWFVLGLCTWSQKSWPLEIYLTNDILLERCFDFVKANKLYGHNILSPLNNI